MTCGTGTDGSATVEAISEKSSRKKSYRPDPARVPARIPGYPGTRRTRYPVPVREKSLWTLLRLTPTKVPTTRLRERLCVLWLYTSHMQAPCGSSADFFTHVQPSSGFAWQLYPSFALPEQYSTVAHAPLPSPPLLQKQHCGCRTINPATLCWSLASCTSSLSILVNPVLPSLTLPQHLEAQALPPPYFTQYVPDDPHAPQLSAHAFPPPFTMHVLQPDVGPGPGGDGDGPPPPHPFRTMSA